MMKNINQFIVLLLFISFAVSCTDDYFEFDKIKTDKWKPELAFPLVYSNLTTENILIRKDTNSLITPNPNTGVLELIYKGKVISPFGNIQVPLPIQNFNYSLSSPTPLPTTGGSSSISNTQSLTFNSTVEIDTLLLKKGQLKLTLENTFEHLIDVELKFDGFTNSNYQTLAVNFSLAASNGSNTVSQTKNIDLNGYTVNMKYGSQNHNVIPIETNLTFNLVNGKSSTSADKLKIKGELNNLEFKQFVGYLGKQTPLDLDLDTVHINIFKNFIDGEFFLSNPRLDISIYNSYGIPTRLNFEELKSRNPLNNPAEIPFQLPQNPITINAPTGFGISKTSILLDTLNSNIDDVVSSLLKAIVYDSKAIFNPQGATSSRNHLTDTSKISVGLSLHLPLEGRGRTLLLIDTLDFNFKDANKIEQGLIRVHTENYFPIDAKMQVYFLDSTYQKIDSLFNTSEPMVDNLVIASSVVNNIGETIAPTYTNKDVIIKKDRLKKLEKGKYAVIEADISTREFSSKRNIRFLPEYTLKINLGLKATLLIE